MKWIRVVLSAVLLTGLVACQAQSPVAPTTGGGASAFQGALTVEGPDSPGTPSASPAGPAASSPTNPSDTQTVEDAGDQAGQVVEGVPEHDDGDDEGGRRTPTLVVSVRPQSIQPGQSAYLTWKASNAKAVTLDGERVGLRGTRTVSPTVTTSYTLIAANGHRRMRARVTVRVTGDSLPKPTATLAATPGTILSGQSSTLAWTSSNATTVTLDGAAVALNGSRAVSPTTTHTYTLLATGTGGSATASATVTVTTGTRPTATLAATPGTILSGQSSTLAWTSTNATTVTLDGAAVALNGSQVVAPTTTHTYTLVATGAGGSATTTATITVTTAGLTFVKDIQPIMVSQCTSCHSSLNTYAGTMAYVTPGSATSRLVTKTQPAGSMYSYLGTGAAQRAETIRSWVVDYGAAQQ